MGLPTKIVIRSYSRRAGEPIEIVSDDVKKSDLVLAPRSPMQWLAEMTCKSLTIEDNDYLLRELNGKVSFRGNRSDAIREMLEMAPDFISMQEYAAEARQAGYAKEEQGELDLFSDGR